jgi:autotransporter-associated beta strand protein
MFKSVCLFRLLLVLVAVPIQVLAQGNPSTRPAMPTLRLPHGLRGDAAVQALGRDFAAVAAHYGKSTNELRAIFRRDSSLRLDEGGHLFYVCAGLAVPQAAAGDTNAPSLPEPIAPLSQTFLLHSRPGATKIIYLDFDGYTISGTQWNAVYNGGADIVAPPWDTDGNPASFGSGEQTAIQQIWLRVAEDYAPFDVDVTTEYPGEAALTRSSAGDTQYGMRALISPISSYIGAYGGVAYVGVFANISDFYKPALIFPENLANSEKYIAEAISHEVGHTLGLSHDGTTTGDAYYQGQGNWAPIMGVGYYKPISQWSKGEYANANNTEDDLVSITSYGFGYRPNDFGTNLATAKALAGPNISTNGVIARTGESDFSSFQTGAGTVQISAVVWERGANLHLAVALYDSGSNLLNNVESVDDGNGTHSVNISTVVSGGTYYVAVTGKGSGNPLTTGYSSYASLGQYTLNLTLPGAGTWLPTPAGNYSWTNPANWLSGNVPNAPDVTAKINNAITGNQAIALDSPTTVGQLILGTTGSANTFTIQNGSGGSLTFDVNSGSAGLQKSGGGADEITADIALLDPTVVSNASPATFKLSGAITGTGSLTKIGAGRLLLAGTNTFSGNLVVSNGTLALDAAALISAPQLEIGAGALLDVPAGYTVPAGQTFTGRGAVTGDVTFGTNSMLAAGKAGQAGTLTFSNNLVLGGNAIWTVDLAATNTPGGGTNDLVVVAGDLSLSGLNVIHVNALAGVLTSPGVYTIATYGGTLTGDAANFVIANASRFQVAMDLATPGLLQLVVSGGPTNLVWRGDGAANLWNVAGATNWFNGATSDQFFQFDTVSFDDTGSNSPAVNLTAALTPTVVTVNASKNYSFTGAGKFSGPAALVKLGSGTLTLSNANDFDGPFTVSAGLLKPANSSALGSVNGATFVTNTGVLDLNGLNLGAEPVVVSGAGAGSGALLNSGATQSNALRFVTLAGDAMFGGSGRWDIRANPTASFAGNGYKLTKTGANELWLVDAGETGLGDIEVRQGLLGLQGSTTAGNSNNMLAVWPGTTLRLAGTGSLQLNKSLRVTNAVVSMDAGSNSLIGPAVFSGANVLPIGSTFVISGSLAGSGSITKSNAGTLILSGSNSYTGTLYVDTSSTTSSDGAVCVANSNALNNFASPIYLRNNNSGSSTLQLDTGVVVTQTIQLSGRNSTVSAIQNLDGSNVLAGGFTFQTGGSNYRLQSDAGTLALGGQIPGSLPDATARMLTFQGAGNHVVNGTLQNGAGVGTLGLIKTGTGDLTLNTTNTYTRGTLHSQGNIYVNSSRAFGTGIITNDTGANTGRIVLGSGVTVTNAIVANSVNPGAGFGLLTVNGNVAATFSGPILFKTNALNGGHIAGPASGGPLLFSGPITMPAGNVLIVRAGNVRLAGGGNYPEIQVRLNTTSLGATNGVATNAVMDIGGNGSSQAPTYFDLNGFNQTLAGLKNAVTPANVGWVTNSAATTNTLTLALGASNYSFGGSIVGRVALALNSGTQVLTNNGSALSGIYNYSGNTTVSGGALILGAGITLPSTPVISLGGATLDASASGLTLGTVQTLTGNGTWLGNLIVNGSIIPGPVVGRLVFSNNVTFNAGAKAVMDISKASLTNDTLQVAGTLTYGGTLSVTNLAGTLAPGDSFKLFNAAAYAGSFVATNLPSLPPGQGWRFTATNGTLTLLQTVATNAVSLTLAVTNGALQFSWPADHTGWTLQVQTNSLTAGLGTNWVSLPATAATNQFSAPIVVTNDAVFYRLIFP